MTILPFFRKLDFLGVSHSPPLKRISSRNSTHIRIQPRAYVTLPRIKISVNTDISVNGFYGNIGNIGNIGKISVDIFTKISVIKIFHILII